jgi:hypothetical protein
MPAVDAAQMERRCMDIGFWWESQKERHRCEDTDVHYRIILKWILEKYDEEYGLDLSGS